MVSLEKYDRDEVEPVVEGELVAPEQGPRPVRPVRRVVEARPVRVVRNHQPTRQATKGLARHTMLILAGMASWCQRGWDASTMGTYRRAIRAAEATNDHALLGEWLERKEAAVDRRHRRMMDLPKLAAGFARVVVGALAGLVALVVLVGVFVQLSGEGDFVDIVLGAASVVAWLAGAVAFFWTPLVVAAPFATLAAAWREGRRRGQVPTWAMPAAPVDVDEESGWVDEGAILGALRHLGIPKLDQAFKRGWGTDQDPTRVWEMGLGKDGRGWRCQIRLPKGVPVSEVAAKNPRLAHNLGRQAVEVWLHEPRGQGGVLDMWIADPGVLTGPVDEWPLLAKVDTATTDYFTGVPVAQSLRGDPVIGLFAGKNWAVAGMMGSGKSSLVITGLLGLTLDPLVELEVVVCAQNGDYEMLRPRLRTLQTGANDETVAVAMSRLKELYAELTTRGEALAEHTRAGDPDADKVTRRLAEKDPRLRPRVLVIDECQALFMHEEYGKEAQRLAILLMNASRKYAITLIKITPEPSTESLPRKLIAVDSNKACFAIGDQQSNDAILGTGMYSAGVSAVGLEPATDESYGDVGTAMTSKGFLAKPGLMRCYHVPRSRHGEIVQRAVALRETAEVAAPAVASAERDLLDDVSRVLDGKDVNAAHVAARLKDLPGSPWSMSGSRLVWLLQTEYGVPIKRRDGYPTVRARDVAEALARQEVSEDGGDDEAL